MENLLINACLKAKLGLRKLMTEEKGASEVIAIVIVLAVVVAIAFAFGKQITSLFNQLWNWVSGNVSSGKASVGTADAGGIILFFK